MKAVLISIQPKWCELIASGKKTIEVRKTKPKLETPFKVYIYCTKDKERSFFPPLKKLNFKPENYVEYVRGNGKVIGEFVCDEIKEITAKNLVEIYFNNPQENTCLNDLEMRRYADGKNLFLWHISDLVIYDKPKELSEFYKYTEYDNSSKDIRPCRFCEHNKFDWSENCEYCEIDFDGECCIHLQMKKPPQSWCYVERLGEG